MNIAIVGYGKMGKEIEAVAHEKKIRVVKVFDEADNRNGSALTKESLKEVDVCIEFSTPRAVLENIEAIAEARKNIVVGTTGWYDKLSDVAKLVKEKKIGLVHAANFSLGMNVFFQLVTAASRAFDKFDMYDVAVSEIHHRQKMDSPSGTALAIGNLIIQHLRRKRSMLHGTVHGGVKSDELHVTSTRLGAEVGRHTVMFDSEADTIELIHNAKNRRGFALGALIAAEWIKGKKGVYTMKDVLSLS